MEFANKNLETKAAAFAARFGATVVPPRAGVGAGSGGFVLPVVPQAPVPVMPVPLMPVPRVPSPRPEPAAAEPAPEAAFDAVLAKLRWQDIEDGEIVDAAARVARAFRPYPGLATETVARVDAVTAALGATPNEATHFVLRGISDQLCEEVSLVDYFRLQVQPGDIYGGLKDAAQAQ